MIKEHLKHHAFYCFPRSSRMLPVLNEASTVFGSRWAMATIQIGAYPSSTLVGQLQVHHSCASQAVDQVRWSCSPLTATAVSDDMESAGPVFRLGARSAHRHRWKNMRSASAGMQNRTMISVQPGLPWESQLCAWPTSHRLYDVDRTFRGSRDGVLTYHISEGDRRVQLWHPKMP